MVLDRLGPDASCEVQEIVGYLNFSSGASDPRFLRSLNQLFGRLEPASNRRKPRAASGSEPAWRRTYEALREGLAQLRETSEAFRRPEQAEGVLKIVFERLLPTYREFHRDLLFHQSEEGLFRPLFIGRVCEAVLSEGPSWDSPDEVVARSIKRLNDFIGHRPVAVLETRQKLQPYEHEWVRPIPLYIAEAGVAVGRYRDIVARALAILEATDEELLRRAWFDPKLLEELAVDPRAFDFDHPNNRRLNYHFGCWDPHRIDNAGFYRRFVLQQVTLDAMLSRVENSAELPYEEALYEAAAVLAGTILMGSAVSGSGPDTHDSATTMATLLPHIASFRDAFYERLLGGLSGKHGQRLRAEAGPLQQPFGGARQHLNQELARRRAEQLQHVHLALLFARMGYTDAATRQAQKVPVAAARLRCEIDCRLSLAHQAIDRGELDAAAEHLPEIEDILHRAIECGALADPWNILGFSGQYSLFPAVENSIPDHRVDELLDLMSDIFDLYARLEKEAAAGGQAPLQTRLSQRLDALARWWDQFASIEVGGIDGVSGREAWQSAEDVSAALAAWHQGGPATGDVAFWRQHVEQFTSPKAFALLTEALMERKDAVASMALLVAWLNRSAEIPLLENDYSFYGLASQWMEDLWRADAATGETSGEQRWPLARKFLDYLEANAEEYWQPPRLELGEAALAAHDEDDFEQEEPEDDTFSAAYENVIYRDSTDDGFESDMLEGGDLATDFELAAEAERISDRLQFLSTIARLWKLPAAAALTDDIDQERRTAMADWLAQALENERGLLALLAAVQRYQVPAPRGDHDAMIEYSRRLGIKEILLERIITACVDTAETRGILQTVVGDDSPSAGSEAWELMGRKVLKALFHGDVRAAASAWPELLEALAPQPLCYIPVSRGGNPQRIVACRTLHRLLRCLLENAPRLGMLKETMRLIAAVEEMERAHPVGAGALTEFDRLFEVGAKGIFECLLASSEKWPKSNRRAEAIVEWFGLAAKPLLEKWLAYTSNVRISVLESVNDENRWQELKSFIERFGGDLFTQRFMNPGNLRAILYQGAEAYLETLAEEPGAQEHWRLLEEIDRAISREDAVRWLELAVAAVAENYTEYVDYNTTTTQSDRGEMLYTLLDFLRLRANYDRMAWGLQPLVVAHKVLVRNNHDEAAAILRREIAAHNGPVGEKHLQRYEALSRRYGMKLPSVADRLGERFVRPLAIDRLCALVRPAMDELRDDAAPRSFEQLEREVAAFTAQPSGAGFDVPGWLEALEDEVQRIRSGSDEEDAPSLYPTLPQRRLSMEEIDRQIKAW
jgi:hypothetical protein